MMSSSRGDKPRLGFLGVGWIGKSRMDGIISSQLAEVVAAADPLGEFLERAAEGCPSLLKHADLEGLLGVDLDGIVIATPNALHAEHSIRALNAGRAVFCQKPLGRNAQETRLIIDAARRNNKLLGIDLSYRYLRSAPRVREMIGRGELGRVFAVDLVFHNAYGPDKRWFYDPEASGGGCLIDLGVHLIDLALWMLDYPEAQAIQSALFSQGERLEANPGVVEDYALVRIDLSSGCVVNIACSWHLNAGCDALIEASFYGTQGGLSIRNVNGSFYDFVTRHHRGTSCEIVDEPPDEWGPRAALDWSQRLGVDSRYDPEIERVVRVAEIIDRIYGR